MLSQKRLAYMLEYFLNFLIRQLVIEVLTLEQNGQKSPDIYFDFDGVEEGYLKVKLLFW